MSKREADNYMTDQNWDQDEEEEEAGVFKQAEVSVLKNRQLKKAKRRGVADGDSAESGTGGIFKSFTGFTKTAGASSAFGSLGSKPLSFSNGSGSNSQDTSKPSFIALTSTESKAFTTVKDTETKPVVTKETVSVVKPVANGGEATKSPAGSRSKYLHQLKALNEGVTKWIKEHVDSNAYCVLTPIFRDYEKYLAEIEKKYPANEEVTEKNVFTKPDETPVAKEAPVSASISSSGGFTLTSKSVDTTSSTTTTLTSPPVFKFGSAESSVSPTTTTTSSISTGLFSSATTSATTASTSSGFTFGSGASSVFGSGATTSGFSFAASKLSDNQSKPSGSTEEEEYVPPKEEVTAVSEDDATYTKRCKLFFKKDDQWKEKGVGNLHLKPCGEKTQLLIRADTNLGNILLNIMLSASLPVSRQGKNNVTIVCVPNPPIDKKEDSKDMVPMLIRVKTGDDADELFEKINQNKR